ncbi:RagB/SusD family nutrient uptake outer membrane protein [Flavobacterium sp. Fl-77]|uniref:RagB/SusD family nutrient uptake outer membrane protein n=1 Tax=Flavobacterium flavipigmentatum TaxID=2893884 RepID=A0AAJ2SDZ8_9FLAO|nr:MULTISPECIES: RagB/SusD family nutrient uptake outer membrane protein [unclassified Flavobacterium]MDX6182693.1 RagB/SusD family nutrient uptake outer membrane protein [Flavobacterium sp. Fl-33]MDX6186127.1 RagB/SusD family nutrient uptake outer membrane protein [Flavobacterium sp. Fl-77]UFH38275.1 SusD/RagB family nutrient-binding outer membrane lipoprotein [Flavobacterium sp. F-70]
MKLNTIKRTAICISLLTAVGCTGDFEDINTNPNGITPELFEQDFNHIKGGFAPMFNNIQVLTPEWVYQLQQGLNSDIWSGYMATPTGFAGGINNTTYSLVDGWNGFIWDYAYSNVMFNAYDIAQKSKGKYDQFYALSLILKVEGMHRLTDTFGPIIYSKFGTTDATIEYDSQQEVYTQMFAELDFAVAELTKRVDAGEATSFATTDLSGYKGDYKAWVKFANTLRLRLAMRIVKVNPALAKTEAEKAVAQKFGVFTANADLFKIVSPVYNNPISTISGAWLDIRMSADMESILTGYNDPRIATYFDTSTQFPGQYKGVRTGIDIAAKSDHQDFSGVGAVIKSKEIVLMTTAEAYFLRAEGALRGWNMGSDAKSLYEAGITASFEQRGASGAAAYIADNVKLPTAYVDPNFPVNNSPAVNNVTIAWDAAATNEVKLQKIITQKWIAGFPEGQEAWSDYRRTGYPKLFPVLKNYSGGTITTEFGVRRINFVQSEKAGNSGGVASGVAKLGGADNGGTRLWWDTTGPNF